MPQLPRTTVQRLVMVCVACCATATVLRLSACDSRSNRPNTSTAPNTTSPPGSAASETLAVNVWRSMLDEQPDYRRAAELLRSEDSALLRAVVYTVPDAMDERVSIEDVQVNFLVRAMRPALEGIAACVESSPVEQQVRTLVGLDHLLAGVMASAAKTVDAIGSAGFSYRNAVLYRRWVLDRLVKLGEPAAAHQPAAKIDLLKKAERERNPDAPIP